LETEQKLGVVPTVGRGFTPISDFLQDFSQRWCDVETSTSSGASIMTSRLSERFHDFERKELYEEALWSGMNAPSGGEQACLMDMISGGESLTPLRPRTKFRLRWFSLPQLSLPFLTWA
jgi:hypothetical protein